VISGGSQVGEELTCSPGAWAPDLLGAFLFRAPRSSFEHQWLREDEELAGETEPTFTPTEAGSYTCRVTASNQAGATSQTSAPVTVDPTPAPTLTLTPQSASNPVGTPHTVTARLQDSGNPVPGAPIVFKVHGANAKPAATRTTAADGRARFTYTGTSPGADTIRACLDDNENGACEPDEVAATANKVWSGSGGGGGRVAFTSSRTGGGDVYSIRVNGSDERRLTTHPAFDGFPGFAAGAGRIAFASTRTGGGDIYVMDADGTDQTQLTTNLAQSSAPDWSSDGKKIAFSSRRTGNGDIYLLQGAGRQRLTTGRFVDSEPSWSPDGTKIAFASNRTGNGDIYVMNADGTNLTRVTTNPAQESSPDWSPFGRLLTFASKRTGNGDIYAKQGPNLQRLTTHPAVDGEPTFLNDGRIAFATRRTGNGDIYLMNIDGSAQTRLTTDPAVDSSPDAP
jgi:Tol biopolymer transport system component